ncbi:Rid family hydrolase [Ramlibacter tataouinensis]|uniref:Rid family hydrolase n=1 Tax=Ramlibacter tataouinensis TaxID=94132 RepID=UPI0022F407D5|nr:Rid family hydrolase [Ramlibacter tataouinensis]WBX99919.1 Rid family hydrolase [Ramlibacter tataouinensis]
MTRQVLRLGKPWEKTVRFSLGVVTDGRLLHTAGITARDPHGEVVGVGDIRAQTAQCFSNLNEIIVAAGAQLEDVVKYTIFTTDIERFHTETLALRAPFFCGNPAATLVEVSRLIDPRMLVEIEAIVRIGDTEASS